jgi:nucleotide-binding universal stress UspA family protein
MKGDIMANSSDMEGCVMLALSAFRKSEKAVDAAIEKSRKVKKLMVVYVADVNVARYLVDVEYGLIPGLKESCESDMLQQYEKTGREHAAEIADRAKKEGIEVRAHVQIGRFAIVCLDVVRKEKPSLVVTTRSKRPEWVRKFFGSPVDELIAKAGCPVIVV